MQRDFSSLSDEDLFAVLVQDSHMQDLRSSIDKEQYYRAQNLAQNLLGTYSLGNSIWSASYASLCNVDGVDKVSAARIQAALEIAKRSTRWKMGKHPTIDSSQDAAAVCTSHLRGHSREHFIILALDSRNTLLRVVPISIGSLDMSIVHPREVFKRAIELSAASVILAHNHPSGDPEPSSADLALTHRLIDAGSIVGIPVVDHIIVGGNSWKSLK